MDAAAINARYQQAFSSGNSLTVEHADGRRAVARLAYNPGQLRPGGTISGPTMMSLADSVMYALVLSAVGLRPLAVTTNLSINFLRKPQPADLIAEARTLKLGKALAVSDVLIRSDGEAEPCAHAVVSYSIPPKPD